jgi:CRP/FNR family cyclic AMP-dependent transcriptional regulator
MNNLFTQNWLLRDLTQTECERLKEITTPLQYEGGKTLIQAGKKNDSLWIIASGRVDIVDSSAETPKILASLSQGDIFGEMSWLDGQPASASTVAFENTQVLRIRFQDFDAFLAKFPDAHIGILRKFAINLSHRLRSQRK